MTKDEVVDEIVGEVTEALDKKKVPLCKDCKFCDLSLTQRSLFRIGLTPDLSRADCLADESIYQPEKVNILSGRVWPNRYWRCDSMRDQNSKCGQEGKLFQRRQK